jgi:hypothetical protein
MSNITAQRRPGPCPQVPRVVRSAAPCETLQADSLVPPSLVATRPWKPSNPPVSKPPSWLLRGLGQVGTKTLLNRTMCMATSLRATSFFGLLFDLIPLTANVCFFRMNNGMILLLIWIKWHKLEMVDLILQRSDSLIFLPVVFLFGLWCPGFLSHV